MKGGNFFLIVTNNVVVTLGRIRVGRDQTSPSLRFFQQEAEYVQR